MALEREEGKGALGGGMRHATPDHEEELGPEKRKGGGRKRGGGRGSRGKWGKNVGVHNIQWCKHQSGWWRLIMGLIRGCSRKQVRMEEGCAEILRTQKTTWDRGGNIPDECVRRRCRYWDRAESKKGVYRGTEEPLDT